ncbi:MAG: hypothetical protein QME16_00080 [Planctomycetota bacterium]|nr:hypothetical protein [Planctomycetota bacterium]
MASPFVEGIEAGRRQSEGNPFNVILGRFREAQARRYQEDKERKKEEAELQKTLTGLQYEYNYRKELEKIQTEEANKREFGKAILGGELTKIPSRQISSIAGKPVFEEETIQGVPLEAGEVSFRGTPFEAIAGQGKYQRKATTESELKSTELKIKQKQLQALEQSGEVTANEKDTLAKLGIPEEEKDDYIIKTTTQTIRGIKQQIPTIERKKTLPAKEARDLAEMSSTKQDLDKNMQMLKNEGLQLGPGFSTRPGAISDMLGQMKGAEFATLKSSIGRSFQKYRKWVTGVAAGYPELNMLAPNYPKATDTNEVFLSKTLDVMKDIERNQEITINYFSDAGFAVSKLRKRISGQRPEEGNIPSFSSEQEAEASGVKGEVLISGRRARID